MADCSVVLTPSSAASSETFFKSISAPKLAPSKDSVCGIMVKNCAAVSWLDFSGVPPGRLKDPDKRPTLPSTKPASAPCNWNGRLIS